MNSFLAIYLQDHHAAAVAGARLARRVASTVSSDNSAADLSRVAKEIAEDLSSLESIMQGLGIKPDGMKDVISARRRTAGTAQAKWSVA